MAKLTAADAAAGDCFGISVAIDGDTIVVGAYGERRQGRAAYVFRTSDGGATYPGGQADGRRRRVDEDFGYSVAIDGTPSWSGPTTTTPAPKSGAAYVFRTTDGGATRMWPTSADCSEHRRRASRPSSASSADGQRCRDVRLLRLVRGDRRRHRRGRGDRRHHRGRAIRRCGLRLPTTGRRRHVRPGGQADGLRRRDRRHFGVSVAIDGDTIVVGAIRDDSWWPVYVFRQRRRRTAGGQADGLRRAGRQLRHRHIEWRHHRGRSGYDDDGGSNSGSAYVFRTTDGGPVPRSGGQADGLRCARIATTSASPWRSAAPPSVWEEHYKAPVQARSTSSGRAIGITYDELAKLTASDAASFATTSASDGHGSTIVVGAHDGEPS